jgi:hypothetical protein
METVSEPLKSSSRVNIEFERRDERIVCGCGASILRRNIPRHNNSERHKLYADRLAISNDRIRPLKDELILENGYDMERIVLILLSYCKDDNKLCYVAYRMLYNYIGRHRKYKDLLFEKSRMINSYLSYNSSRRRIYPNIENIIRSKKTYEMMAYVIHKILEYLDTTNKEIINEFVKIANTFQTEATYPRIRGVTIRSISRELEDKLISSIHETVGAVFDDMEELIVGWIK